MSKATFEPDVTIGDLLVLAKLSSLIYEGDSETPSADAADELGASATRIRNSMMRLAEVLGPIEIEGRGRRTQRPSPRGRNMAAAGVIADMIIKIAKSEKTDQTRLLHFLKELVEEIDARGRSGSLNVQGSSYRF